MSKKKVLVKNVKRVIPLKTGRFTPEYHRRKVASKTLCMTPEGARIAGGMTFSEAYEVLFGIPLRERLTKLLEEHPNSSSLELNTELCKYGWSGSTTLRELLRQTEADNV